MRAWLLGLALALAPLQERVPSGRDPGHGASAEVRLLLEDVRAWIRDDELPAAEDVRAVCAEVEALGPESRELVKELGRLGHHLGQAGRKDEARALVEWSGARAELLGDLQNLSWSCEWLGQDAWSLGELDQAAAWLERAAGVDERRRAPTDQTRHLGDVASLRLTQGRFDEALAAGARAEAAARAAGSDVARRTAAGIRGSLLFELGRHREALSACLGSSDESLDAARTDVPRDEPQVRLDILVSDVLADVGRLESALAYARRAHALALEPAVKRVAPLLYLEAQLSLGLLLGDLGRLDEAVGVLDAAEKEFVRLGDERGVAWAAKNRGFARITAGRAREALPDFERAWHTGAELGVPFLEGIGALGVAEALVLGAPEGTSAPHDVARVHEALATAERVARDSRERTLEWRCAALRGRILLAQGEDEAALAELMRAIHLIERWRRRLGYAGLVQHALRARSDPYRDAAFAAAHLGRFEEALAISGLLQARVLDELRARRDGPLPAPESAAREVLRERITRLEHRVRESAEPELLAELARAENELDATQLAEELASGRVLTAPEERLPVESLAQALGQSQLDLALVYLVGARETLVLCLEARPSARVSGRLLAIGEARLAHCIERLRGPLARLEAGAIDLAHLAFDVKAARELAEALVVPLDLPRGARLALVLDGVLSAIPFELFVVGGEPGPFDFARPFAHLAGLRFLGDEHALVSYGSLARLARDSGPVEGDAVLFRPPAAIGLPHAAAELAGIARALGGARLVADARPADVTREVRGAALVHFAAHGRVDPASPAHGHLLLGGSEPGTSARLESWHAAELELDGALVVLSACHSARGEWLAGEGLAGLTRGFFLAGAREVVASQWAVDDRVTARFMELFYAELARAVPTPEAARRARVALRKETDPRGFALAHPAFWAAWSVLR